MPPNKPSAKPRAPGAVPSKPKIVPDDAALQAIEAKYTQREAPSLQTSETASSQARSAATLATARYEPSSLQASETASSQARSAATLATARSGTLEQAYVRARDGQATRSTTIHLPVELHQRLRIAATARSFHMSAIVAEAVGDWLETHNA